jgi:hypothetical protein
VLEEVEEGHFPDLTDIFFLAKAWILACHRDWSTIDQIANYPSHFDAVPTASDLFRCRR